MKNYDILKEYKARDLRRLAKGKISAIVGMDAKKILEDLSKVLGNYESVKNNIEFRPPPSDTILEIMLESENYSIPLEELREKIKERIKEYETSAKKLDMEDSEKKYGLYGKVVSAAWDYGGDLVPSEANILRVLREELGISIKEHQMIMAHPDIHRLYYDEKDFSREIEFLTQEGIILVYKGNLILSEETAESIKQIWGIELEKPQFERLLGKLKGDELSEILKNFGLLRSGTKEEKIERIIREDIKPSDILSVLSSDELSAILKKEGLSQSGKKEEKIERLISYFKSDADIKKEENLPQPEEEEEAEERILPEEKSIELLQNLTTAQLERALRKQNMPVSGTKNQKIDRLVNGKTNIITILNTLTTDDLRSICKKIDVRSSGNKDDLIKEIVSHYAMIKPKESKLSTRDLLDLYVELSMQDTRAYPEEMRSTVSSTTAALDFERVTKHIFENIFHLETRRQRFGREEPDGKIKDEDGNTYYYECKTVLNPPYRLPITHRLQIRNYIERISRSKERESARAYFIISNSFVDDIEEKIKKINPPLDMKIAVISAGDLLSFAKKWMKEYPNEVFPLEQVVKNGRITLEDFNNALY